jgi:hypothetical protein
LHAVELIKPGYFSAKDAKDAKNYCDVQLTIASDNHCGKFLIKLEESREIKSFRIVML